MIAIYDATSIKKTFFYMQVLTTLAWREYRGIVLQKDEFVETAEQIEIPIVSRIWEGKRFNGLCDEVYAWKRDQIAELNRRALNERGLDAENEAFKQSYSMTTQVISATPERAETTLWAMGKVQDLFALLYYHLSPYVGMKVAVSGAGGVRVDKIIEIDLLKLSVTLRNKYHDVETLTGDDIQIAYGGFAVSAWTGKGWQANFADAGSGWKGDA